MATKKASGVTAKTSGRGVRGVKTKATGGAKVTNPRPAPVKKVPASDITHSKTMANGQPRPKKRG